jgi:hypothetical protein
MHQADVNKKTGSSVIKRKLLPNQVIREQTGKVGRNMG